MLKRILAYLASPFYFLGVKAKMMNTLRPEINCFKNYEICKKLSEEKNFVILPDISLGCVKKRTEEISSESGSEISVNDFLLSVFSKTIHDYDAAKKGQDDPKLESINLGCPYSLRPKPACQGEYVLDNCFVDLIVSIRVVSSIVEGTKIISRDMQTSKNNYLEPFALKFGN